MSTPLSDFETLFKALADVTRLRILGLLLTGEVCVCQALVDVSVVHKDAGRLRKRNGCCLPSLTGAGRACCTETPASPAAGR